MLLKNKRNNASILHDAMGNMIMELACDRSGFLIVSEISRYKSHFVVLLTAEICSGRTVCFTFAHQALPMI